MASSSAAARVAGALSAYNAAMCLNTMASPAKSAAGAPQITNHARYMREEQARFWRFPVLFTDIIASTDGDDEVKVPSSSRMVLTNGAAAKNCAMISTRTSTARWRASPSTRGRFATTAADTP